MQKSKFLSFKYNDLCWRNGAYLRLGLHFEIIDQAIFSSKEVGRIMVYNYYDGYLMGFGKLSMPEFLRKHGTGNTIFHLYESGKNLINFRREKITSDAYKVFINGKELPRNGAGTPVYVCKEELYLVSLKPGYFPDCVGNDRMILL